MLNLLDDGHVLLQTASITNSPELINTSKAIRFEFWSSFEQCVLTLHQDESVLNDVLQNKISRLFALFDPRVVTAPKQ